MTCENEARHAGLKHKARRLRCPIPAIHLYQYNNYIHHVMPICVTFAGARNEETWSTQKREALIQHGFTEHMQGRHRNTWIDV